VSIHPPPYLIDYRVALALMSDGNIGPSTLVDMLDKGDAYFFDGQKADFEKCTLCAGFLSSHKKCFQKSAASDLPLQGAVAAKLIDKGKLLPERRVLAAPTLRMAGIAAREGLTCVVDVHNVVFDNLAAYKAAAVRTVSLEAFLADLKP